MTSDYPHLTPEGAEFMRQVFADEPSEDPEVEAEREYWQYWSGYGARWEREAAKHLEAQLDPEPEAEA